MTTLSTPSHDRRASHSAESQPAISKLLTAFAAGDPALFTYLDDKIDLRIEHYDDPTDVSWQQAQGLAELGELLGRLGTDVFPQGTRILGLECRQLGDGWYHTEYVQRFWYPVQGQEVIGRSVFISHELNDQVDYLREIVLSIVPA